MSKRTDINILDNDIIYIFNSILKLSNQNKFLIKYFKNNHLSIFIRTESEANSIIKLFISSKPHIIEWKIIKNNHKNIYVEINEKYFKKYSYFFYSLFTIFILLYFLTFLISEPIFIKYAAINLVILTSLILILFLNFISKHHSAKEHITNFYNSIGEFIVTSKISITSYSEEMSKISFLLLWSFILLLIIHNNLISFLLINFFSNGLSLILLGISILPCFFLLMIALDDKIDAKYSINISNVIIILFPIIVYLSFIPATNYGMEKVFWDKLPSFKLNYENTFKPFKIDENQLDEINKAELKSKISPKEMVFYLLLVLAFVLLFTCLMFLSFTRDFINRINPLTNEYYKKKIINSKVQNFILFIFWGYFSILTIFLFYMSLSLSEIIFFNTSLLIKSINCQRFFLNIYIIIYGLFFNWTYNKFVVVLSKIVILLFLSPIFFLFSSILVRNILEYRSNFIAIKNSKQYVDRHTYIKEISENISEINRIKRPLIAINNSKDICASVDYISFPYFSYILHISEGIFNLNKNEIILIIAHEIYHIKKHALLRFLLCFLSDYTLFGKGFLSIIQNSYNAEKQADLFAFKTLGENIQSYNTFKNLLEKQEEINFIFNNYNKEIINPKLLYDYNNISETKKLFVNIKLFFRYYFFGGLSIYTHPSVEQRIQWLQEELVINNEANSN